LARCHSAGTVMHKLTSLQGSTRTARIWLVIFLACYVLSVLINLSYFPLDGEEPRRAIIAIEMMESGNFIRPTTMGWEYYNKPPLYNWIISGLMILTGSSDELAVRLASLLSILAWGLANYYFVRKLISPYTAVLSSLFLMTSLDLFFWGLSNGGEIDVFYSLIVYLQAMTLFYFNQDKRWTTMYLLSYALCAVGFLTKGSPSLLFQGLTLAALCVYNRSVRILFHWAHFVGIALLGVLVGSYFYVYSFYGQADKFFVNLLKESLNKSAVGENRQALWKKTLMYPAEFLKLLLPWSLFLFFLIRKTKLKLRHTPLVYFALLFILFNIPVYWFTGKPKMRYVYMFIPFALMILTSLYASFRERYPEVVQKVLHYMFILFALVLAGLIILPFLKDVNEVAAGICILLLAGYLVIYRRLTIRYGIICFVMGLALVRLVYAVVLIPVRYEAREIKYDQEMENIADANDNRPLSFYKKPDTLDLDMDLEIVDINEGKLPVIPDIAYEMPHYYYLSSGQIMQYDTILRPGQSYIGYRSDVRQLNPEVLYSFKDKYQRNEEVILFRMPPVMLNRRQDTH